MPRVLGLGLPRWPAWCWVLLVHSGLLQSAVLIPRMTTSYRALELGVPVGWLGAVAATFALAPLLAGAWLGRIVEVFGEGATVRLAAVAITVASAGYWLVSDALALLLTWTAVLGFGQVLGIVGAQSMIATRIGRESRPAMFGWYGVAVSIGQVVGPAIAARVGGSGALPDTGALYLAGGVLAVLLVMVSVVLVPPPGRHGEGRDRRGRAGFRDTLARPGVGPAIVAGLMVVAATDLLITYLPAFGAERGIAADVIAVLLAVRAAAAIASRAGFNLLLRRLGWQRLLVLALAAAAAGLVALPLGLPVGGLAVAMAVIGGGLGLGMPLTLVWVSDAVPAAERAQALSLRLMGTRVGQSVIPMLVGQLATAAGIAGVLWVTAGGLGAVAADTLWRRRTPDPQDPDPQDPGQAGQGGPDPGR